MTPDTDALTPDADISMLKGEPTNNHERDLGADTCVTRMAAAGGRACTLITSATAATKLDVVFAAPGSRAPHRVTVATCLRWPRP
jgi:hypothetical protein